MKPQIKVGKWSEIKASRTPTRAAAIAARADEQRQEYRLTELRKALALTQATGAETMSVAQGEISKIENREDLYLSTLDERLRAIGAELVVIARFNDRDFEMWFGDAKMKTIKVPCSHCGNQTRISYTPEADDRTEEWGARNAKRCTRSP